MMQERTARLGEGSVSRLLLEFSIPAIIGMIANSFYTLIDRLFVGNIVGTDAIAGMSITMPISFITFAFAILIGAGASAVVSLRLGEQKQDEAEKILGNAFTLSLIISLIISGSCLLSLDSLLRLFGASDKILPYGRQFISIILYGSIFMYISFGLSNVIRAEGNPRIAMATQLINSIINVILDCIFIYYLGLGLKGAAVATVISQAISAVWVLAYLSGKTSLLKLRLKNMPLKLELVKDIFAIGMAPFFLEMVSGVINILYNHGLGRYGGDSAIAAFGIINTLTMFILMPIFGINQGAQPIIGYNYGALKFERVKATLEKAILAATAIVTIGFIVVEAFPAQLLGAFSADKELIGIGVPGMRIWLLTLPIVGIQIVGSNFFQAIGKAAKSLILTMLRQVIVLIPMLIILPPVFHLNGVWLAGPVSDVVASLVTFIVLVAEVRSMQPQGRKRLQSQTGNRAS